MLTAKACAKINLTLEVLGSRPDGYHEIISVIQSIDLMDILTFEPDNEIVLNGPAISGLKSEDNLIVRAARMLQTESGCTRGAQIGLTKRIPVAAGLGGGSSDAAAALLTLNELWGLGWSVDQLLPLARKLGSDVAYFLFKGTALVTGRGDVVTSLPPFPESWIVLLKPPIDIVNKTAILYTNLDESHFTDGEAARGLINSLGEEERITPSSFFNVFEAIAYDIFSGLKEYHQALLKAGASVVHLCGAGPTIFTIMPEYHQADRIFRNLSDCGLETYMVQTAHD